MRKPKVTTGKKLKAAWSIPAMRVYFHQDGTFYEVPLNFPAALCDMNGYVLFSSYEDLKNTPGISIGEKVNVHGGVFALKGYAKSNKPIS